MDTVKINTNIDLFSLSFLSFLSFLFSLQSCRPEMIERKEREKRYRDFFRREKREKISGKFQREKRVPDTLWPLSLSLLYVSHSLLLFYIFSQKAPFSTPQMDKKRGLTKPKSPQKSLQMAQTLFIQLIDIEKWSTSYPNYL